MIINYIIINNDKSISAKIFLAVFLTCSMSELIQQINDLIQKRTILEHPFYEMWSAGELKLESLAGYSKEYFQLVKAVPEFMKPLINQADESLASELHENMLEEVEHIEPWIHFASSLGVDQNELNNYTGTDKTRQAVTILNDLVDTSFESGVCAMYTFEKEIPHISEVKLEGLKEFYDITSDHATEYFKLHTEADIRHVASWRKPLERVVDEKQMLQVANKSLDAQHLLLDACKDTYC